MSIDLNAPEVRAAIALVDALIEGEQRDRKIPGMSAGIVYDQDLIWQRGYGYANLEKQIPADAQTVYRIASITKLFTATMLMKLRDAGRLSLDDPIEKYLPGFSVKSGFPDARPPTFRQVVAHSAGLPREGDHQGWRDMNMPTAEALLESLSRLEMAFPTMVEPKYSNLGISLMGYALSKIAGQEYGSYVEAQILKPLGMDSSGFDHSRYGDDHYAVGYDLTAEGASPSPHWDEQGFRPGGGMYSTVEDITKFIAMQFRDQPAGGSQVLGGSTIREMHMPISVMPDFETGFGVGWGIRRVGGHKVIGHSGGLPGYTTNITLVPALRLAAIVFTNTGTNPVEISQKALELLIPVFQRQQARLETPASAEEIAGWQPYLGRYGQRAVDDVIDIEVIDGKLMLTSPGGDPKTFVRLMPHGEHRFRMMGGAGSGDDVVFELDAAGRVTGLMLGAYPFTRRD
ncbi:MAG: beta-lactamase family protein [Anaerolineae bacterium]|nr:beta-lactamase family protein [Anaerolineae bacterium]